MISAAEALERLREGNRRFVEGDESSLVRLRPDPSLTTQSPFAVVLGCSDSRVPAEIIFNQGLGDLFVIRVAGNIVAPSLVGSVEFATANFGTRLVVVLGHTDCGAVQAAVNELDSADGVRSANLAAIVDRIIPGIEPTMDNGDFDTRVAAAVRANIRSSTEQLKNSSEILSGLMQTEGLTIIGAEYDLVTGRVEFFDTDFETSPR